MSIVQYNVKHLNEQQCHPRQDRLGSPSGANSTLLILMQSSGSRPVLILLDLWTAGIFSLGNVIS